MSQISFDIANVPAVGPLEPSRGEQPSSRDFADELSSAGEQRSSSADDTDSSLATRDSNSQDNNEPLSSQSTSDGQSPEASQAAEDGGESDEFESSEVPTDDSTADDQADDASDVVVVTVVNQPEAAVTFSAEADPSQTQVAVSEVDTSESAILVPTTGDETTNTAALGETLTESTPAPAAEQVKATSQSPVTDEAANAAATLGNAADEAVEAAPEVATGELANRGTLQTDTRTATAEGKPETIEAPQPDTSGERGGANSGESGSQSNNSGSRDPSASLSAEVGGSAAPQAIVGEATSQAESRAQQAALDTAEPSEPIEAATTDARANDSAPATERSDNSAPLARLAAGRIPGGRVEQTDAANAGPRVDAERFVGRVSRAVQSAHERGGEVRLRLSPPELGTLQIKLTVSEGALTATLETETTAARNALLDNLPALRERLAEQEIRVEKFDVDVRDERNQQDWTPGDGDEKRESENATGSGDAARESSSDYDQEQTVTQTSVIDTTNPGTINLVA